MCSRYYRLREWPPPSESLSELNIQAAHRWGLPAIKCDACGETWATTGVAYPTVYLDQVGIAPYDAPLRPLSPEAFAEFIAPIMQLLNGAQIPPGAQFGPLDGTIVGQPTDDVTWLNPWTILLQEGPAKRLQGIADLEIRLEPANLAGEGGGVRLLELEVRTRKARKGEVEYACEICKRQVRDTALANSVDDGHLFRPHQTPAHIVVDEFGYVCIQRLGLTGWRALRVE